MDSVGLFDYNDIVSNRQLFTACSAALLILFACNYIVKDCADVFGLVTANTLITNTYVWNLVTPCFYETNPIKLIIDIFGFLVITRSLTIGSIEQFFLYFTFSLLACTIGTSVYCFVSFFSTGQEAVLITPIYGFGGILMAVLMFARHQYRDLPVHEATPFITYHNLPVLIVAVQMVLKLVRLDFLAMDLHFSFIALFFSWSYLRFYYKLQEGEPWGDRSEEFSFVNMFPERLHIVVIPFTTAFYNMIALMGLFPPLEPMERRPLKQHHLRYNDPLAPGATSGSTTASTSTAAAGKDAPATKPDLVAERRRAKAMKLLDAKMAELSQQDPAGEGWDDVGTMDDLESLIPQPTKPADLAKYKV